MGGRKRTPTQVLETRGAFIAHPERKRSAEVKKAEGIGDPPTYLSPLERECWHEFVRISLPGVLTVADRPLLEVASRLWAEMRAPDPRAEFIGHARLGRFMVCLASMGMTPADRSKVVAAGPESTESVWDAFERPLEVIDGGRKH